VKPAPSAGPIAASGLLADSRSSKEIAAALLVSTGLLSTIWSASTARLAFVAGSMLSPCALCLVLA
jgi:hypothetical protein